MKSVLSEDEMTDQDKKIRCLKRLCTSETNQCPDCGRLIFKDDCFEREKESIESL